MSKRHSFSRILSHEVSDMYPSTIDFRNPFPFALVFQKTIFRPDIYSWAMVTRYESLATKWTDHNPFKATSWDGRKSRPKSDASLN